MPNEVHKPSRKQAVLFFLFTLALAGGIIAWLFILNKGSLTIESGFPLHVSAGVEDADCAGPPCALKLTPGSYTVIIRKAGFFDDTETVHVVRGQETKITPHFQFIPVVREVGELVLPTPNAPLQPPFLGTQKLENFPKNVKDSVFSASGNNALLTIGKELYVYDVTKHEVSGINLAPDMRPVWAGEDLYFLENAGDKQVLKRLKNGKTEVIVSFDRPFVNPTLLGDFTGKKVLIMDETSAGFAYYLVDIERASRKRLEVSPSAKNAKWTLHHIIFEYAEKVFAIDADTLAETPLSALDTGNVNETSAGVFVFVAAEQQDLGRAKFGPSIDEVLKETEQAVKITTGTTTSSTSLFVTEFHPKDNSFRTLATVILKADEEIHRLTTGSDGTKIYFEKAGRLFVIDLEKP